MSDDEALTAELIYWKRQSPFLADVHSQVLQQRLKDLSLAIAAAFDEEDPRDFPKFKKRHKRVLSFRYPQGFKVSGNSVYLSKIGWVPFYKSRDIEGNPKNCTVSEHGGNWYISVQTEQEVHEPVHPSTSAVGIDMGTENLVALSTGEKKEPIFVFKRFSGKLAVMQRRLARMKKRSSNWKKQQLKIQRLHARIAAIRLGHLHEISSSLCKNHALVVLEELPVKNMTASARGTSASPGEQVKQKSALNRSILDQGWSEFRGQLEYKMRWSGGRTIAVPPHYTSQTCSHCGHGSPEDRPSRAMFYCIKCGHTDDADVNAAKNILRAGLARLACGSNGAAIPSEAGTAHRH